MTEQDIIEIKKLLNKILKNNAGYVTIDEVNEVLQEDFSAMAETWTFTLDDDTQVTKKVLCLT